MFYFKNRLVLLQISNFIRNDTILFLMVNSGCMTEVNCSETPGFLHYARGVFTSANGATLHAMAIVGYGLVKGTPMWIVRNSWSDKWGDKVVVLFLLFFLFSFVCENDKISPIVCCCSHRATYYSKGARTRAASPKWSFVPLFEQQLFLKHTF